MSKSFNRKYKFKTVNKKINFYPLFRLVKMSNQKQPKNEVGTQNKRSSDGKIKLDINFDRISFNFSIDDLKNKEEYKDVKIFNPIQATVKSDLLIKIVDAKELMVIIPCHKDFLVDNIPVIGAKFRENTNWVKEQINNIDTFTIDYQAVKNPSFEQSNCDSKCVVANGPLVFAWTLCDLFAAIYRGYITFGEFSHQDDTGLPKDVGIRKAFKFYYAADYLQCIQIKNEAESYICKNLTTPCLIEAWNIGTYFEEHCSIFMDSDPGFHSHKILDCVNEIFEENFFTFIDADRLSSFLNKSKSYLQDGMFINILICWFNDNINKTSTPISIVNKTKMYKNLLLSLDQCC